MTLPTKNQALIALALTATAFATGRYSVNTTPTIHTVTDTRTLTQVQTQVVDHTVTKIVEVKAKDGTDTKTTTIKQDDHTDTDSDTKQIAHVETTVTPPKRSAVNISLLGATNVRNPTALAYGVSVSKEVLGPLTVGAFGLTNGIIGVSVGLNF